MASNNSNNRMDPAMESHRKEEWDGMLEILRRDGLIQLAVNSDGEEIVGLTDNGTSLAQDMVQNLVITGTFSEVK